jgi:hypothetical protein
MEIGDTITVSYEESRTLRKQGWRPRNDVVVMTYVGKPEPTQPRPGRYIDPSTLSQDRKATNSRNYRSREKAKKWNAAEHAFVARKLAEAAL